MMTQKRYEALRLFATNDHYVGDKERTERLEDGVHLTRGYGKAYWALDRDRPEETQGSFKPSDYVDSMCRPTLITKSWGKHVLSDEPSNIWDEATREYHKGPHYDQVIVPWLPGWANWQPFFVCRVIPLVAALVDYDDYDAGYEVTSGTCIREDLLKVTDEVCRFFVQCKEFGHCDSGGTTMEATYVSEKAWGYLSKFPGLFGDSKQTSAERLAEVQESRDKVASGVVIAWAI